MELLRGGFQDALGEALEGPRACLIGKTVGKHDVHKQMEKVTAQHVATIVGGASWVHSGLDT